MPSRHLCSCCLAASNLQVLEMQSCDVDGNEWMDSFDAWRTEVVKSLLVTFFVQPPEGFSAGGVSRVELVHKGHRSRQQEENMWPQSKICVRLQWGFCSCQVVQLFMCVSLHVGSLSAAAYFVACYGLVNIGAELCLPGFPARSSTCMLHWASSD